MNSAWRRAIDDGRPRRGRTGSAFAITVVDTGGGVDAVFLVQVHDRLVLLGRVVFVLLPDLVIIGVIACMRFIDFMLVRVSGVSAILMITEKAMITHP